MPWPAGRRNVDEVLVDNRTYVRLERCMKPDRILGAVTTLSVTDPATCDRGALAELAGLVRQVRGWLDAVEATIAIAPPGFRCRRC